MKIKLSDLIQEVPSSEYDQEKIMEFCKQEGIDLTKIDLNNYENNNLQELQMLMDKFRMVKRDLSPKTWDSVYGAEYWRYERPEQWLSRALSDIDLLVVGLEGKTPAIYRVELLQKLLLSANDGLVSKGINIESINWRSTDSLRELKAAISQQLS